jgi:23S rRNA (guanosine2251-2'-O)-methyltransferase
LTEKASQTIYQQDLKGPTALIFGSEDIGISSGVLKLADVKAKLPIENEIDSLNVSVACGIVFYEAIRQRL